MRLKRQYWPRLKFLGWNAHFLLIQTLNEIFCQFCERKVSLLCCGGTGRAIQILLCGSLIPILLSFLMTINEDIYSAQFGCRPQNVQVCPSATFIGVDISRCSCTDLPSNVTTSPNTQSPQIGQITKYQNYQNSNVTFFRDHQCPSEKVLVMTMTSTFVSPPGLIGCDDVELGKPYNLTVLHSYDRTLLCYYPWYLHSYRLVLVIPITSSLFIALAWIYK